jgi:hypothetical protein
MPVACFRLIDYLSRETFLQQDSASEEMATIEIIETRENMRSLFEPPRRSGGLPHSLIRFFCSLNLSKSTSFPT